MRKLASIQTVNAVEPIPNADAIEKIRVLGWWVVVEEGRAPARRQARLLRDRLAAARAAGVRVPPRQQLQARPDRRRRAASSCPPGSASRRSSSAARCRRASASRCRSCRRARRPTKGADVTDLLGVLKWEPPLPVGMGGKVKGGSPASCRRPTRPACRCWSRCCERHRGKTFYVTEKLDGTSFTAFLRAGRVRHLQPEPVDGRGRRVERPRPGRPAA